MKKLIIFVCILTVSFIQAQDKSPLFERAGDLVKATYYHADGSIEKQGFFKNKKLEGTWTSFDKKGNKTAIAHYKKGKKVGKWFMWEGNVLREINFENSAIASVQTWKEDTKIAVKTP